MNNVTPCPARYKRPQAQFTWEIVPALNNRTEVEDEAGP